MRKFIVIAEGYRCVGSCTTAFDNDGHCIIDDLPWVTTSDFALADEMAEHMDENEFYRHVPKDDFVEKEIDGHQCEFLQSDGVFMIYDCDTDVHYFFA